MVRRIISEGTDIDVEAIEEGTTLESLGLDSLDMVELVCDLEEACGIEFGDAQGIKTVGQLVSHIDERL
jgi:acyl carrier protein